MPYRKKFKRVIRRKGRKSTPWYNRKYSTMQLARSAWNGVKYIRGLVNSEMFHVRGNDIDQTVDNTGYVRHITAISQADGPQNRTGNSILARKFFLRYILKGNTGPAITIVRVMLIRDKQQVGDSSPTITDVLDTTDPLSLLDPGQYGRFEVLYSKIHTLNNTDKRTIQGQIVRSMMSHVRFNGTADTDIQRNGLYLMAISDQATTGTAEPTINFSSNLSYRDN